MNESKLEPSREVTESVRQVWGGHEIFGLRETYELLKETGDLDRDYSFEEFKDDMEGNPVVNVLGDTQKPETYFQIDEKVYESEFGGKEE